MTGRAIDARIDALFVEGPDDGAVVNALIKRRLGIDLAVRPWLVRTKDDGGGARWAVREFEAYASSARPDARVGLIVDRDDTANDGWPPLAALIQRLDGTAAAVPDADGTILRNRYGIWMWPDNQRHGDLEAFLADLLPRSAALEYAREASRVAKRDHAAEYEVRHERKAALKVRSVWRDASGAGGYGHLVRNLELTASPGAEAFVTWFTRLFLT